MIMGGQRRGGVWKTNRLQRLCAHKVNRASPQQSHAIRVRLGFPSLLALCLCASVVQTVFAENEPTFAHDIAPIVFEHCGSCHRPGGDAPFSLLTYDEVKKRAGQIAEVTKSRFMPPWLPLKDCGEFLGRRGLSDQQVELIKNWVDAGAPEGDSAAAPSPPPYRGGWILGPPDLVLTMTEPFVMPAGGTDVLRSFVIPIDMEEDQLVTAIEFRPSNPRAIHHASFLVDTTGTARMLDNADPGPGYLGMADVGLNQSGSFGGWALGAAVVPLPPGMARKLPARCDLGVNIHFNATGKTEEQQAVLGLHFAKPGPNDPPPREVQALTLGSYAFEVPANAKRPGVIDEFTLPVDVKLIGISAHAHYLCTRMSITATLPAPGGSQKCLLKINDWDFNWQQPYQLKQPLDLPAGTRLRMEFDYDNTESNPRNPRHPPKDVRTGHDITDEMAFTFLHVLAGNDDEAAKLAQAHKEKQIERLKAAGDWAVRNPRVPTASP